MQNDNILAADIITEQSKQMQLNYHVFKIKQIYVNKILKIAFLEDLKRRFNLVDYYDNSTPAIFYGLMNKNDIVVLEKHKSLKIVIWIGGDINYSINRSVSVYEKIHKN